MKPDSAIIIWTNHSGVIAENLEQLKNLGKPTFICEHSTRTNTTEVGWLDPKRTYDPYYHMKEYFMKKKQQNKSSSLVLRVCDARSSRSRRQS